MEIPGDKGIDGSVGALVWVRRRNGSWWPGRILSPDELPEGCLSTPKSGTPVKLLGREDASVDWYNLEKSKRVKAFRCGEYDDCIEKAKSMASNISKKAVKYARREDAIIHALRLENARMEKDFPGRHNAQEEDREHQDTEEDNDNQALSSESEGGTDSALEPSQSVVSFEEPNHYLDSKRRGAPNDLEDNDRAKRARKRMRGLEDLGMGVDFERRKRTRVGHGHEFLKKKNRRRTLSKVLERTPMLFVPVASPTGLGSHESNKINNNNNSDSTNGVSCENGVPLDGSGNGEDGYLLGSKGKEIDISSVVGVCGDDEPCERLFDVPLAGEKKQEFGAGVQKTVLVPSQKAQPGAHSSQSSCMEALSRAPFDIHNTSEKDTSKWQLKGKRNSRPRKIDIKDESETHADIRSNRVGGPLLIPDVANSTLQINEGFPRWSWNNSPSPTEKEKSSDAVAPVRLLPYRQSRFTVNPKYDSADFSLSHHTSNNSGGPGPDSLYDVEVKLETSHRPQHVPCISLMSKLNRKPIVGHPLSVEVLEDGCLGAERTLWRQKMRKGRSKSKSRRNGVMSKKIKKLSSLSGSRRQNQQEKKLVLESLKGPSIACIPLKVVFSRINASLNSSVRPQPRLSTT